VKCVHKIHGALQELSLVEYVFVVDAVRKIFAMMYASTARLCTNKVTIIAPNAYKSCCQMNIQDFETQSMQETEYYTLLILYTGRNALHAHV
jgi:hypothetical protein